MTTTIVIHGWLKALLRSKAKEPIFSHPLDRSASSKDIVESLGIPHTEVGKIMLDDRDIDLHEVVRAAAQLAVFPHVPPVDPLQESFLTPIALPKIRFVVDHNVAKLAAKLRMVGIDAAFNQEWHDEKLAEVAATEQRILLSRDIQLLKRKKISHGHYVRETNPNRQLGEIIHFYDLGQHLTPFSRCMSCNTPLVTAEKEEIIHLLEPLTKKYYHSFTRCPACEKVFWPGTHRERMDKLLRDMHNYQPLPY